MRTKGDLNCCLHNGMKGWARGVLKQSGNHTALNGSNKLLTILHYGITSSPPTPPHPLFLSAECQAGLKV